MEFKSQNNNNNNETKKSVRIFFLYAVVIFWINQKHAI